MRRLVQSPWEMRRAMKVMSTREFKNTFIKFLLCLAVYLTNTVSRASLYKLELTVFHWFILV